MATEQADTHHFFPCFWVEKCVKRTNFGLLCVNITKMQALQLLELQLPTPTFAFPNDISEYMPAGEHYLHHGTVLTGEGEALLLITRESVHWIIRSTPTVRPVGLLYALYEESPEVVRVAFLRSANELRELKESKDKAKEKEKDSKDGKDGKGDDLSFLWCSLTLSDPTILQLLAPLTRDAPRARIDRNAHTNTALALAPAHYACFADVQLRSTTHANAT
jgi:hypothetical protein